MQMIVIKNLYLNERGTAGIVMAALGILESKTEELSFSHN